MLLRITWMREFGLEPAPFLQVLNSVVSFDQEQQKSLTEKKRKRLGFGFEMKFLLKKKKNKKPMRLENITATQQGSRQIWFKK